MPAEHPFQIHSKTDFLKKVDQKYLFSKEVPLSFWFISQKLETNTAVGTQPQTTITYNT